MGNFEKLLAKLDETQKSLSRRYDGYYLIPSDIFYEKTRRAWILLDLVEKSEVSKDLKLEARKNFIINCTTALEVFLKDMLIGIVDILLEKKCHPDKIDSLFKEKITLGEAYQLLSERKISAGLLIASKYSFHNLEVIDRIFSVIINGNFLESLGKFEVKDSKGKTKFVLDKRYHNGNWRNKLAEFLYLRHKFVHQIKFKDKLGLKRILKLWECLSDFVEATEQYLFQYIPIE